MQYGRLEEIEDVVVYGLCAWLFGWTPEQVDAIEYEKLVKIMTFIIELKSRGGDVWSGLLDLE